MKTYSLQGSNSGMISPPTSTSPPFASSMLNTNASAAAVDLLRQIAMAQTKGDGSSEAFAYAKC